MLALSQTSPYLIKLLTQHHAGRYIGSTAGLFLSVSTVGSIAGTLATSFYLIPRYGVKSTLGVFSVSTVVVAGIGIVLFVRRRLLAVSVLAAICVASFGFFLGHKRIHDDRDLGELILDRESMYGQIRVYRHPDENGNDTLVFAPSRMFVHTQITPTQPLQHQFPLAYITPALMRNARDYLVLGVAGGHVVSALHAVDPSYSITAVDIDPATLEVAKDVFGVPSDPHIRLIAEDARVFLRRETKKYDYIMVDAFSGEQPPAHCVTQEFFELVRAHLNPNGVMFVNTNMKEMPLSASLEPVAFSALHHIESSIFHAGFSSIFDNDLFYCGFLYAPRSPMTLDELRRGFVRLSADQRLDRNVRLAAALSYLATGSVPATRASERPFTDEWVPEYLLQRKSNEYDLLDALVRTTQGAQWSQRLGRAQGQDLDLITADLIANNWRHNRVYGLEPDAYCSALASWLEKRPDGRNEWTDLLDHVTFDPDVLVHSDAALQRSRQTTGVTILQGMIRGFRGATVKPRNIDKALGEFSQLFAAYAGPPPAARASDPQ
jgi:predicted O-methyltransferase YrrM